jgi:ligand-binding SRPBCC domain-containing protein
VGRIRLETPISSPIERAFDAARDIDLHVESMASTDEHAVAGRTRGLIGPGEDVTFRARHFGVRFELTSRVTLFEPPTRFVDEQVRGPFAAFRHEHRFASAEGETLMIDNWVHRAPLGALGRLVDWLVLDRYMRRQLRARAAVIRRAAERG